MPGDIIGVLLLRNPLMVPALLAVFKAGCGYLPLDHHHPESRIAFMLEDAAVKVGGQPVGPLLGTAHSHQPTSQHHTHSANRISPQWCS